MRPCNQCGTPVDNADAFCTACASKPIPLHQTPRAHPTHELAGPDYSDASDSSHWSLVLVGAALSGIPTAVVMMIASQIVFWFRLPLLTTCYIGAGVVAAFTLFGGLADLLSASSGESG